jgi:hypothetical protein
MRALNPATSVNTIAAKVRWLGEPGRASPVGIEADAMISLSRAECGSGAGMPPTLASLDRFRAISAQGPRNLLTRRHFCISVKRADGCLPQTPFAASLLQQAAGPADPSATGWELL